MNVLLSGASGLIGTAATSLLGSQGHRVVRLVRGGGAVAPSSAHAGEAVVRWDPASGAVDAAALEGLDAVVHLAGEDIASGRWTAEKKARIRQSRADGTERLARALAACQQRPAVLACASAVGYYGDRGDETLTEESPPGSGFLAEVCRAWEAATRPAADAGIRVVTLRFGMVLSAAGGALARMLGPFRLGMGGPIGSGRQYVSWIDVDDAAAAILHSLATPGLRGPVNAVSPEPVTQSEFASALGRVLGRPTVLSVPAFGVRLMFGELADELLLASQRVIPLRLPASGFAYRHPALEPALRHAIGR